MDEDKRLHLACGVAATLAVGAITVLLTGYEWIALLMALGAAAALVWGRWPAIERWRAQRRDARAAVSRRKAAAPVPPETASPETAHTPLPPQPPHLAEQYPDRISATGTWSMRDAQIYDPRGRRFGLPYPSRSVAKRVMHDLAHPGDLQRKNRKRADEGCELLIHSSGQQYEWFDPESKAYDGKRSLEWRRLDEMGGDRLWNFAALNVYPLIDFEQGVEDEARNILREDPRLFRAWIERKLTGR